MYKKRVREFRIIKLPLAKVLKIRKKLCKKQKVSSGQSTYARVLTLWKIISILILIAEKSFCFATKVYYFTEPIMKELGPLIKRIIEGLYSFFKHNLI